MTKKKLKNQFTRKIYLHKLFDSFEHGDLNVIIRNNSVTLITEQLATDLSDIMMDLKNNSVYDRKKLLQEYDLAI